MKILAHIGRALFSLAFIGFGINHFRKTEKIALFVPDYFPAHIVSVYIVGILFIILGLLLLVNYRVKIVGIVLAFVIAVISALVYLPEAINNKMAITVYVAFVGSALFIAARSD
jgi:uncharacterized membrane protein